MYGSMDRINLNGCHNIETRLLETKTQTTRTREQVNSNRSCHLFLPHCFV
jgi:hypothetical protein